VREEKMEGKDAAGQGGGVRKSMKLSRVSSRYGKQCGVERLLYTKACPGSVVMDTIPSDSNAEVSIQRILEDVLKRTKS
jgi:hypothetical protein